MKPPTFRDRPETGCRLGRLLGAALLAVVSTGTGSVAGEADDALAWAEQDFRSYCAPCHGLDARGDGPVAEVLKVRPTDLTRIARRSGGTFPADTVYARIEGLDMPNAHGTSDMPVWGIWFTNQAIGESVLMEDAKPAEQKVRGRIRALVGYLETIQE